MNIKINGIFDTQIENARGESMKTLTDKYTAAKKQAMRAYRFYDRMQSSNPMKRDAYNEWQRLENIVTELEKQL